MLIPSAVRHPLKRAKWALWLAKVNLGAKWGAYRATLVSVTPASVPTWAHSWEEQPDQSGKPVSAPVLAWGLTKGGQTVALVANSEGLGHQSFDLIPAWFLGEGIFHLYLSHSPIHPDSQA